MTVDELINILQQRPRDQQVYICGEDFRDTSLDRKILDVVREADKAVYLRTREN